MPTMGALHEGHLSLIRAARRECDVVVVSLFVNPAQFNERSDLERYPREEIRDTRLARDAGADILFAPDAQEVYPEGFSSFVQVLGLSERLEGAARGPEHFRGVMHGRRPSCSAWRCRMPRISGRRTPSRCS